MQRVRYLGIEQSPKHDTSIKYPLSGLGKPYWRGDGKAVRPTGMEDTKETWLSKHNGTDTLRSHRQRGNVHKACTCLYPMGPRTERRNGQMPSSLCQMLYPTVSFLQRNKLLLKKGTCPPVDGLQKMNSVTSLSLLSHDVMSRLFSFWILSFFLILSLFHFFLPYRLFRYILYGFPFLLLWDSRVWEQVDLWIWIRSSAFLWTPLLLFFVCFVLSRFACFALYYIILLYYYVSKNFVF